MNTSGKATDLVVALNNELPTNFRLYILLSTYIESINSYVKHTDSKKEQYLLFIISLVSVYQSMMVCLYVIPSSCFTADSNLKPILPYVPVALNKCSLTISFNCKVCFLTLLRFMCLTKYGHNTGFLKK